MLVKHQDLPLLNSPGIIIERTYLTEKKTKRKEFYGDYGEYGYDGQYNSKSNKKVERGQGNLWFYNDWTSDGKI